MKGNHETRLLFVLIISLVILNLYVSFQNLYQFEVNPPQFVQDWPGSTREPTSWFHDCPPDEKPGTRCYEDSWILRVEKEVTVNIVGSKTLITFEPLKQDLSRFREGPISPITFYCDGKPSKDCDLKKPFLLYANNRLVRFIKIETN